MLSVRSERHVVPDLHHLYDNSSCAASQRRWNLSARGVATVDDRCICVMSSAVCPKLSPNVGEGTWCTRYVLLGAGLYLVLNWRVFAHCALSVTRSSGSGWGGGDFLLRGI